jgi:hypothetical protein
MATGNPKTSGSSTPLLNARSVIPVVPAVPVGNPPSAPPIHDTSMEEKKSDYGTRLDENPLPEHRAFLKHDIKAIIKPLSVAMKELNEVPYHETGSNHGYYPITMFSLRVEHRATTEGSPPIPLTLEPPTAAIEYLKETLANITTNDEQNKFITLLRHLNFWKRNDKLPPRLIKAVEDTEKILNKIIKINYPTLSNIIQRHNQTKSMLLNNNATLPTSYSPSTTTGQSKLSPAVNYETKQNDVSFRQTFIMDVLELFNDFFHTMNKQQSEVIVIKSDSESNLIESDLIFNPTRLILGKPTRALEFIVDKLQDASVENVKILLRHFQYWLSQPHLPKTLKDLLEEIELKIFTHTQLIHGGVNYSDKKRERIANYRQQLLSNLEELKKVKNHCFSPQDKMAARSAQALLLKGSNVIDKVSAAKCCFWCCYQSLVVKDDSGDHMYYPTDGRL